MNSAIKWKICILGVKKWWKIYTLTYSFFCYCTSTEGTYHRQFGKCARFSMFRSWAKILLFLSNKTFQMLILKNIHITKSYIIKFFINIWNHGKNLQDLSGQNPLLKWWIAVTFGHLSWFSWTKTTISFFYFKDYYKRNMNMKGKTYVDGLLQLLQGYQDIHPLPRREKFSQT